MEITVQQLLCLTTFFVCLIPVGTVNKLVFVQAVWGDGHIAPRKRPYPKDPYNETAWPRGWDRLTDLGIQQLYELGTFFREEYNTFIKQSHVREEVAIYSSMSDSAAISAQVFTFGFYPAQGNFQYQNISSWQPIPIHEVGDLILRPWMLKCTNYDKIKDKDMSEQAAKYSAQYGKLFKFFEEKTGISNFSFYHIDKIHEIHTELIHNMTEEQPEWIFETWPEYGNRSTMEIVKELYRIQMITGYNSPQKSKMQGGFLLHQFIRNALNAAIKIENKMLLFSAHDDSIYPLLYAMNVANDLLMPYAATVIMEIHREGADYLVEFFYRNETTQPPYQLSLPICGTRCTVQQFASQYSNMFPRDYNHYVQMCETPMAPAEVQPPVHQPPPPPRQPAPVFLPPPLPFPPQDLPLPQPCENVSSVIRVCDNSSLVLSSLFSAIVLIVMNLL